MVKINYVNAIEHLIVIDRVPNLQIDWDNPLYGTGITERQSEYADTILIRVSPSEFWVVKSKFTKYHKVFVYEHIANDIIEHHISQYAEIVRVEDIE